VNCRIELDLRIGAAFTRLQTLFIQREAGAGAGASAGASANTVLIPIPC